jgi:hypothetical protein
MVLRKKRKSLTKVSLQLTKMLLGLGYSVHIMKFTTSFL